MSNQFTDAEFYARLDAIICDCRLYDDDDWPIDTFRVRPSTFNGPDMNHSETSIKLHLPRCLFDDATAAAAALNIPRAAFIREGLSRHIMRFKEWTRTNNADSHRTA